MDISTNDLRTLLAGMAMQGLLANPKNTIYENPVEQGKMEMIITETAISHADSLIKNLEKWGE
jgi:hypothetical protein